MICKLDTEMKQLANQQNILGLLGETIELRKKQTKSFFRPAKIMNINNALVDSFLKFTNIGHHRKVKKRNIDAEQNI